MINLLLVEPNKDNQMSFERYVSSYQEVNDIFYYEKYKKGLEDFDEYLNDLRNYSKGIDLPQDMVTTSTFWLIDHDEVVGVARIRHEDRGTDGHIGYDIAPCHRNKGYGTQILRLALEKAANIGINEVIVTCNVDNAASRKIIEKSNGILLGTMFDEEENENLFRYSILTK